MTWFIRSSRVALMTFILLSGLAFLLLLTTKQKAWATIEASPCPNLPSASSTPIPPQQYRTLVMDQGGVSLICSLLNKNLSVLEFGSGGSTTFFSEYVASWTSVEHDIKWARRVRSILARLPWGDKVTAMSVPSSPSYMGIGDGTEEEFRDYLAAPISLGKQWDLIIDDGRARVGVGKTVLKNHLLKPGGRMVVHDWERKEYKNLLNFFSVVKEDPVSSWQPWGSSRATVVLKLQS